MSSGRRKVKTRRQYAQEHRQQVALEALKVIPVGARVAYCDASMKNGIVRSAVVVAEGWPEVDVVTELTIVPGTTDVNEGELAAIIAAVAFHPDYIIPTTSSRTRGTPARRWKTLCARASPWFSCLGRQVWCQDTTSHMISHWLPARLPRRIDMGLFHATCNISNLPIRQNEQCRLVFLVKSPDYGGDAGHHTGHALWAPWSLPLQGTYDGYGRLLPYTGWHTRFILERLQDVVVEREEGFNPITDLSVRRKDLVQDDKLKRLQDLIRDNRMRVFADVDKEVVAPFGMAFIREDVYRTLAEAPMFTRDVVHTAKDAIARELTQMSGHKKNSLHSGELAEALKAIEGTLLGDVVTGTLDNLARYRRLTESVGSYGPTGYRGIGAYRLHVAERVMAGVPKNDPELTDEAKQLGIFMHVILHFEELRRLWQPQNGLGATRTGWGSHTALASIVHHVAHGAFESETETYEDPKPSTT